MAAIATPILIAVGGGFAWWKFFRQDEHAPRLQPTVTAAASVYGDTIYVVATTTAQNTGQVDVYLSGRESALVVYTTTAGEEDWTLRYVNNVFRGQEHVQPGETLEDQKWIEIPKENEVAVRLDLTVAAQDTFTWSTIEIASLLLGETGQK